MGPQQDWHFLSTLGDRLLEQFEGDVGVLAEAIGERRRVYELWVDLDE